MRARPTDSGFTLLEVLVALVVAGMIAAVLLPGLTFAEKRERQAVARIEALAFAESQLRLLQLQPLDAATEQQGQTVRWRWSARLVLEPIERPERQPARLPHNTVAVSELGAEEPLATLSLDHVVATRPPTAN